MIKVRSNTSKNIIALASTLVIICLLFYTCEKEDFRDPYTGSYDCRVKYKYYEFINDSGPPQFFDSLYRVILVVSKHQDPDLIQISGGANVVIRLEAGGKFKSSNNRVYGKLGGNSINLNIFYSPAAVKSWTYNGVKITK